MIVVDSSAWLEVLLDGPLAEVFAERIDAEDAVIVPAIVVYEVYKVALRERGEEAADTIAAQIMSHDVAELDADLAVYSAMVSTEHGLPMADAIVYATALAGDAVLLTSDVDSAGLPNVDYLPKPGDDASG